MKSCQQQDSFNCSHIYTKYLIMGLSLYKSNCIMIWHGKQNSTFDYKYCISAILKDSFKLEKLLYVH